jgi:hypothetical protein
MFDVYLAQDLLLTLGAFFVVFSAYQAFDTPPIKLGDGPTLPLRSSSRPLLRTKRWNACCLELQFRSSRV